MKRIQFKFSFLVIFFLIAGLFVFNPLPLPPSIQTLTQAESILIYARDGKLLWQTSAKNLQGYRHFVPLETVSPQFKDLLLRTEDKRFYAHLGVDPVALIRAIQLKLKSGRWKSGASTISMQLVRLSRPGLPRNFKVKFEEALLSLWLECSLSKNEILELYVNHLPFGQEIYGVSEAAKRYYHKDPSGLNLQESAELIATIRAPSLLNPSVQSDLKEHIQNQILDQKTSSPVQSSIIQREYYFPHWVNRLLAKNKESAKLRTTIDFELQTNSHAILNDHLKDLKEKNVTQGAVLIVDHQTGEVLSYVGSKNYLEASSLGQIDGIAQYRQPGSALKPFLYALALQNGISPQTWLEDQPKTFETAVGYYEPQNYNRHFHGQVLFRHALASSLNVPALNLHEMVGVSEFYHQLKSLGFSQLIHPATYYGLGMTLGNFEVSLWELVQAYTVFANQGQQKELKMLLNESSRRRFVYQKNSIHMIRDMLSDDLARSLGFGEEGVLSFDFPVMVKTGTSQNYRDNWTVAVTPRHIVGVWVGNFNGQAMKGVSGVTGAAPVMREIVEHLYREKPWVAWKDPVALNKVSVCSNTSCRSQTMEFESLHKDTPRFVKSKKPQFQILSPLAKRTYRINRFMPAENQKLKLKTSQNDWIESVVLNGQEVPKSQSDYYLPLVRGKNRLSLKLSHHSQASHLIYYVE